MAHQHYKGTGNVHSFKGYLTATRDQEKIRIEGSVGAIAWRIKQFRLFPPTGDSGIEATVKVYREKQTSVDNAVNFTDDELLAAAMFTDTNSANYPAEFHVVFDNALFVRNIWITGPADAVYTANVNYYIELEEVKVSQVGMAQLAVAAARRNRFASE